MDRHGYVPLPVCRRLRGHLRIDVGEFGAADPPRARSGGEDRGSDGVRLPPSYSLFGKVVAGLETVAALDAVGSSGGSPKERVQIDSVTITEAE